MRKLPTGTRESQQFIFIFEHLTIFCSIITSLIGKPARCLLNSNYLKCGGEAMKIYALLQSIDYLEQVQETIDADSVDFCHVVMQ